METKSLNRLRGAALASVALAAIAQGPLAPAARAQALQPVVDVCTGITLPRSAVTEVIEAVNQPIVDQVETTVNGITTVTLILDPLAVIPDLDIDLSTILADAAAGDPISLQILDTDGNVIGASDACNIQVDGIALDTPAGIAIGGNQITGLGADGQPATAGELDAIAFGNNAATAPGATGAVAIGTDASATAANSVALGAGSVADRGPVAGYAAPGIAGTSDSAGSVSVGSAGAERQVVNVAPGTAASDAATVGQVTGAVAAATADSVQYDDATHEVVTLDGVDGTLVTNVADGALGAASTDAVNGSQLFATNEQVAANTADVAALEATAVQYDDPTQTSVTLGGAGGTTISNLAPGELSATSTEAVNGAQLFATNQQVATNTTNITNLQTDVADLQTGLGTLGDSAVQYDDPSHATVTLDGAAGTTIGNVAAGDLGATSTEAVNGSQLFATNEQVATNTGDIADLDTRVTTTETSIDGLGTRVGTAEVAITNLGGRVTVNEGDIATLQAQAANVPVRFVSDADGTTPSPVPTDTAALISASGGATTLTNVAPGTLDAASTDAVNGSQLFATNQQVATNTADIQTINNNLAGSTVVAVQYSNPATPTVSNGGTITNDVTLIGANPAAPVRVHNVAAGTLPNDAVNLGQMQSGLAATLADAQAYTDDRFEVIGFDLAELDDRVGRLREDAFNGTAAAMALAGIPQTMDAGRSMVGGGVGHYRGETAFAIGLSTSFNDGRAVVKAAGTMDTRGKGGFAAGAGFSF